MIRLNFLLSAALIFLTCFFTLTKAQTVGSITYIALPPESIPMGIVYDSNSIVYVALYWNESIIEVNINSQSYNIYRVPTWTPEIRGPMPWSLCLDPEGNLWVTIRSVKANPNTGVPSAVIYKFDTQTKAFEAVYLPVVAFTESVTYYDNYVWAVGNRWLFQIDYTNNRVLNYWELVSNVDVLVYTLQYNSYLWISAIRGQVIRFNPQTSTVDYISGFARPLGLAGNQGKIYVAEHGRNTIQIIDAVTLERLGSITATDEVYCLLFDSLGNLWWTDNTQHVGYLNSVTSQIQIYPSEPYNYFMTQVNGEIWFSCQGSAYIGIIRIPGLPEIYDFRFELLMVHMERLEKWKKMNGFG